MDQSPGRTPGRSPGRSPHDKSAVRTSSNAYSEDFNGTGQQDEMLEKPEDEEESKARDYDGTSGLEMESHTDMTEHHNQQMRLGSDPGYDTNARNMTNVEQTRSFNTGYGSQEAIKEVTGPASSNTINTMIARQAENEGLKKSLKVNSDTSLVQAVEGINKPATKQEQRERSNIVEQTAVHPKSNTTLITQQKSAKEDSSGKIMQNSENKFIDQAASSGGYVASSGGQVVLDESDNEQEQNASPQRIDAEQSESEKHY